MSEPKKTTEKNAIKDALADADATLEAMQSLVDESDDLAHEADASRYESSIDMLGDVELEVTIELGRAEMMVEDVLQLGEGSVVELDKLAGDPVDVLVNGHRVARGEVLVLNDNFCIRVSEIVANLEQQAQSAVDQATE
tara:strand:- start:133 stop:549 length:417 start_codon:yes stop_codon:yes gene_type:complete